MTTIKKLAAAAAVATLALAASDLSASAQSSLTNGPNGMQPNTLSSDQQAGIDGDAPSRSVYRRPVRTVRSAETSRRPLTVRRTVAVTEAPVVVAPVVVENTGPGRIITGPLGLASNVVSLPFRALNGIFPATGDLGSNPLFLIGGPVHAFGDIVQIPFRVIGAPFGGTTIATY